MYIGINAESGKLIREDDAFSYACERVGGGTEQEQRCFLELAKQSEMFSEFKSDLVAWFYSGNWIKEKED